MYHRFLFAVFASVVAATTPDAAPVPAGALLAPGVYGGVALVGFTARDAQPIYTDALARGCPSASAIDGAAAKAGTPEPSVLLGTSDGRIVVSESIQAFPNATAAKGLVKTAESSPGCIGYAARNSINRVFVQYPEEPPIPTFAPASSRDANTLSTTFEGTSPAAPFVGLTALITWDDFVAEATIRIASARPGELDLAWSSIRPTMLYLGIAATGAGSDPELAHDADTYAEALAALSSTPSFGLRPSPRGAVPPSYPPSCSAASDAYFYSAGHAALRGFAGEDPTSHISVTAELLVFPGRSEAARYVDLSSSLTACFRDLYGQTLPPGSTVTVERVPKRGSASRPESRARSVAYFSTLEGPGGARLGMAAARLTIMRNRVALVRAQIASPDTVDVETALDRLDEDVTTALATK